MNTAELNAWAAAAHGHAKHQGFYDADVDLPDRIRVMSRIALIHAELAEVTEAIRRGWDGIGVKAIGGDFVQTNKFRGRKPEGVGAEVADVFLRVVDLGGWRGHPLYLPLEPVKGPVPNSPPHYRLAVVGDAHAAVSHCTEADHRGLRLDQDSCQLLVNLVFALAADLDVDLDRVVTIKHAYNLTRPRMHGKLA